MTRKDQTDSRRGFLRKSAAGLAGATILSAGRWPEPRAGTTTETAAETKRPLMYRTLGKTGLKVSIVSMGVMNADNPNLVRAALDAGIIHLDTAHVYQRGRNEEMVGQVIKDRPRDSFVLGTKVRGPNQDRDTGLFGADTKAEQFIEDFHISLKRLQVDYVDILYLHNIKRREAALFEPLLSAMVKLKKEGKARFIGVSTHRNEPEVLRAAVESKAYDVVLTAFNFRQDHRDEVRKAIGEAAAAGLGIVAMKTQAGVYWDRERQHPINMTAALKWALQDEHVHTAIPGFTTFDQLETDLSVMADLTLTPGEKEDLRPREETARLGLYCQQCDSCRGQCAAGLDIPALMRGYMYAHGYRNLGAAKAALAEAGLTELPCGDCGECRVSCRQGFDVRRKVLDVARLRHLPDDFLA
jgi:predicted aldo/keto reductase-like oxidoreductase